MSIKAIGSVLDHSKQQGTALVVMIILADFMNDYGDAWPSIDTLARKSRCSRSSVIEILKKVELEGELEMVRRAGPNYSNIYRFGDHYRIQGWKPESLPVEEGVQNLDGPKSGPPDVGGQKLTPSPEGVMVQNLDGPESGRSKLDGPNWTQSFKEPLKDSPLMESSVPNGSGPESGPPAGPVQNLDPSIVMNKLKQQLRPMVGFQVFNQYIRRIRVQENDPGVWTIYSPSHSASQYLESRIRSDARRIVSSVVGREVEIEFGVDEHRGGR